MADFTSLQALAARVETLERQARRLKRQIFAALVALLFLGTVSATVAQEHVLTFSGANGTLRIDASGIHFVNASGAETALIGYTANSTTPAIRYYDASGVNRMFVGLDDQSDGLVRMWNAAGKEQVGLDGNVTLTFYDKQGSERLYLGTTTSDDGDIQIFNAADKLQTELAPHFLRIADDNTTQRAYIGITTSGTGVVQIFNDAGSIQTELAGTHLRLGDAAGTERGYIGLTENNESIVKLWDGAHVMRNFIGTYSDGSSGFSAYNASGTASWSRP